MNKIGLVTYELVPGLTPDDVVLLTCLKERGIEAVPVVWDAPHVEWKYFDALVARSCWDYHLKAAAFSDWLALIEESGIPLWNPVSVIRWNMNKFYLKELAAKGVKIPQTVWLDQGSRVKLASILAENKLNQVVFKPTISNSAHNTWRTDIETAGTHQSQLDSILNSCGVLIQEFCEQVVNKGEWSILFFGGKYSHAVLKQPKDGDFRVQSEFGGTTRSMEPSPEIIKQAQAIIDLIETPLLYARVDGVENDGVFTLLELELIEPELFLGRDPLSCRRFAEALRFCTRQNT